MFEHLEHFALACGMLTAISNRNVVPMIADGLQQVEYRGYDSAGIAVLNGHVERIRRIGKVAVLAEAIKNAALTGSLALGHTRWATHGKPDENNSHPHVSRDEVVIVHNGTIENHNQLREELVGLGYEFKSETDTEVAAHLIHYYSRDADLLHAVQKAVPRLMGVYAFVVCSLKDTNRMIGVKHGCPLIIGRGKGQNFAASDPMAFIQQTKDAQYLEDGDIADIEREKVTIYHEGMVVERPIEPLDASSEAWDKQHYAHYMLKEIHEQPKVLADTVDDVLRRGISPALFGDAAGILAGVDSVLFLACGTSSYAGRVAQQWMKMIARVPAYSEIASEYKSGHPIANPRQLVVTISQSGETGDTLEALKFAKEIGHEHTLSICNVKGSSIPRESKLVYYTKAGVEVGVASTKAFTTQLAALFILTLAIAKAKGVLTVQDECRYIEMLRNIPGSVYQALQLEEPIKLWAAGFAHKEHALFLGRTIHHPIALEGALKLKEISYIHAEAYPAGELKHGPIALIDEDMPVVVIAPNDELFSKLELSISEVQARGAQLYVFTDEGSTFKESEGVHVMRVPRHDSILSPIMHVIPVQLLAYHVALLMECEIDQPRNLAKSVTVG